MSRFLKSLFLLFLILFLFASPGEAQTYNAFDGNPDKFHVDLKRYFESTEMEARQRQQLFNDVSTFLNDSTWKTVSLVAHLEKYELLLARLERHYQYFRISSYINNKDTTARKSRDIISQKISVLAVFTGRRLQQNNLRQLTPKQIGQLGLGAYAWLINGFRMSTAHTLSAHDEALADQLTGHMINRLTDRYDELMDDISGSGVITTKGVRLDAIRDRSQILKSNDSTTRRLGAIAYNEAYSQHAEMLAAILIDITSAKNTLAKLRGFQSAPARSYSAKLQLPESSVKSLLNEMMQHADVLKAYQELQAAHVSKLTGLNQVHSYDLFFWGGYKWVPQSYNDIRQLIQKALTPLGEGYETAFAWLLEPANGALDISGGPNRVNENTSVGYPGVPVSLYMKNYNGALTDVLRLSHEGGHAVHMKLMFDLSIPSYASGPSFMFEAFAMLNELLVLDELRQQAESKEARVYYTQQFLNKLAHELFTSAEEGTFEQQLYDGVSAGKINKRKDIDSLYAGIMNKYDFFFESEPERKSEWINKRLLFDDPLYNVNYLYAMLVTCKLYDQFHQDPQKFATQYNALLKNGFNDSAENLLEKFMGFKLDHEILLNSALKLMQNKSDELIELWRP